MKFSDVLIVGGLVFGLCFLVDKVFSKMFRDKQQHKSGESVRFNRRYGAFGMIAIALGAAAVFAGLADSTLMLVCGGILILVGIGLVIYYMTFGVFYDEEAFVYTSFGKRSITYRYSDIQCQQLFNSYGNTVIELQMADGKAVQLISTMDGVYPFLDKAFGLWLEQTGRNREECTFHDPQNSCWFPPAE